MQKLNSFLLASALAGTVGLTALTPAAYAHDRDNGMRKHRDQGQHMQQRGGDRMPGAFVRLMCSEDGAARLETALNGVETKITLTDEQKTLLADLKTAALAAQTEYADNCVVPEKTDTPDMAERMKTRHANMAAQVAAMDDVVPAFEVFYDTLSDEQKAEFRSKSRMRGGDNDQRRGGDHKRQHHDKRG
ncbi:Spy/CpxP family protein refolding chaperone [Mariluticola halotolerans]|uniref:Spy/CpxP family protein refolding chaperone n=1 Tax=Mariluticola halotolerans TaxID=2909283 RepID=UPI0026E42A91|nr:Spy/CpxP family protein refolding chaperone [Mariluticola halotolerans]UJQ94478.1 Spy/CpxP family protein refolding chaperone [Mariluticola halotolerans]